MRVLSRLLTATLLLCLLLIFPLHHNAQNTAAAGYHDYAGLSSALKELAQQNSRIIQLRSIGKTGGGRDIWMLQISGTKGPDPLSKQALLIVGNAEGDHVIGSEVALGIALVASVGAESLAGWAGCAVRTSRGAVPVSVVAAIVSVHLGWIMCLFAPRM